MLYVTSYRVCSCAFTDDSSMLAAGFENSQIKVWTLSNHKLRSMKSGDILTELDKESGMKTQSLWGYLLLIQSYFKANRNRALLFF